MHLFEHKYLIAAFILHFLDQIALVRSKCIPCCKEVPVASAQSLAQEELPVGIDANQKPPAVGVDGVPVGGFTAAPKKKKKNRCCPYDFNSTNCRTVNNRLMCGYDKNFGSQKDDEVVIPVETQSRCQYRAGRLECGYKEVPAKGIRRPPAWDKDAGAPKARVDNPKARVDNPKARVDNPKARVDYPKARNDDSKADYDDDEAYDDDPKAKVDDPKAEVNDPNVDEEEVNNLDYEK